MTPEAQARQVIDERLRAAGWEVPDDHQLNLGAAVHEQRPQSPQPRRFAASKAHA
jgi:hypothetical protein